MSNRINVALVSLALSACGGFLEYRLGAAEGIPKISGSQAFSLGSYTCEKAPPPKAEAKKLAEKPTLPNLPATVRLEGATLTNLKAAIDARIPASVHATATLLVPMSPAPPASLKVIYDAQPTIVLGP